MRFSVEVPDKFGGIPLLPVRDAKMMGVNMALYGPAGSGKTTIAGKLGSKYGPLLYIDAEGGASAITSFEGVHWAPVTSTQQIMNIGRDLSKGGHPFRTIVIDNMSEIQSLSINRISGGTNIQIQHWGECTTEMLKITRVYRDMTRVQPLNVIFIAWEDTEKSQDGVVTRKYVGFTPSLARQFPGIVGMVGYLSVFDKVPDMRILSFKASPKSDAKFRVDRTDIAATIPQELYVGVNANPLEDMFDTIYEGKKFPVDKYQRPRG